MSFTDAENALGVEQPTRTDAPPSTPTPCMPWEVGWRTTAQHITRLQILLAVNLQLAAL